MKHDVVYVLIGIEVVIMIVIVILMLLGYVV